MNLKEVSSLLQGIIIGENVEFEKISIISLAKKNDLSFIKNNQSLTLIKKSKCKNFIISNRLFLPSGKNYIIVKDDILLCLEKLLLEIKKNEKLEKINKISEDAIISTKAHIGQGVSIGKNTLIDDNVKLYDNVQIGNNVKIYSGAVIGKPGFSHYSYNEKLITLNGIATVRIEDEVEIGANTCIDGGIFNDTIIGKGTKIDNLCQIGHDVRIGTQSIICSQVGIAGYTQLGNNVLIYGKVGIGDSLILGDNFIGKAYSAITKSFPKNFIVSGIPAREDRKNLKKISKK